MAFRPHGSRATSYRLAQAARWPRPPALALAIVLLGLLTLVWRPLVLVTAVVWALVVGSLVLDARLRGTRGIVTTVLILLGGPVLASLIALVTRRHVRKTGPTFAGAGVHAAIVAAIAGGAVAFAGYRQMDRVAFTTTAPSGAMSPRIASGDLLLVSPLLSRRPTVGEVVATRAFPTALPWRRSGRVVAIGRVVGVAGDWVGANAAGVYACDRVPDIQSPIVPGAHCRFPDESAYITTRTPPFGPVDVPPGFVFLLGDERADLTDSRTYGPVPVSAISGRVVATVWPFGRIAIR